MNVPFRFYIGVLFVLLVGSHPLRATSRSAELLEQTRQKAVAFEQQGDNAAAEAAWRSVLKIHPNDVDAFANLGLLAARQERYTEAVPLYRKALALNPSMPGLRLNLGLSLFKSGALKEAIEIFSPLLRTLRLDSPDAIRVETLIGMAHYGLGEYAAAIPYLKQTTAHDPHNMPFRLTLAHSCLWSKQYQCVLDVYREILALNAESAEADMLAGEAYDEMKNDAAAIEQFRAAVKADPKEPNVHFGLGYLLWRTMKYPEAAQEFQAELANNPGHVQALAYLADTDLRAGHPEAAQPRLEKVIAADPAMELAHLDLGAIYSDAGRKQDALQEMELAAKLNSGDINVHWQLAKLYQSLGRRDEAKAEFDKTRNLQKAANDSIFSKLKEAQDKGKPAEETPGSPLAH